MKEVLDRLLEDDRQGILCVGMEGEVGGLVGMLSNEENVDSSESEYLEEEERTKEEEGVALMKLFNGA